MFQWIGKKKTTKENTFYATLQENCLFLDKNTIIRIRYLGMKEI